MPKPTKPETLDELLERVRHLPVTPAHREAQRRSFAYGNAKMSDPRITRESIDEAADKIDAERLEAGMKDEYDFSGAVQAKFYRPVAATKPEARVIPTVIVAVIFILVTISASIAVRVALGPMTYWAGGTGTAFTLASIFVGVLRSEEHAPWHVALFVGLGVALIFCTVWPAVWAWSVYAAVKRPYMLKEPS